MTRLVLINGAPGSGKSTVAQAMADEQPLTLALDVDALKHSLGGWQEDLPGAGLHARRLALALAREQLTAGYDVVIGQYLARTGFIEELERLAAEVGARFLEVVLDLDTAALAARLADRSRAPTRPEHLVNNTLVAPEDAGALVASLAGLREARPDAIWVDARASLPETLDRLRAALRQRRERQG